jgi:protein-disulfide isomerase
MMQLMSKLLIISILSSLSLFAKTNISDQEKLERRLISYVKDAISVNPNFKLEKVKIRQSKPVEKLGGNWRIYFLDIDLIMTKQNNQKMTVFDKLFSNGDFIVKDFLDIVNKASLKDKTVPDMDPALYRRDHLLYGNFDAPNKIVAFSDPVCPFCISYMPKLIEAVKAHPDKIALFYYHFPLTMLHEEAPTIIKAALVAEKRGVKDVIEKVYKNKFELRTGNEDVILKAFNKAIGTRVTKNDIKQQDILKHYSEDLELAGKMMINGTPTIYVNGKKDFKRNQYKELIK